MFTAYEGGVSTCHPANDIISVMSCGGYWNDYPRGFVDEQVERQIRDGIDPDHAHRYARAVAFGGCSESEAWSIIRDRDCARFGTHHELIKFSDLPDGWFRDAWSRGHNGGPIFIDMVKARNIQWRKISFAVREENKSRELDLFGRPLISLPKDEYRSLIMRARDEDELKKIWPEELPRVGV